MVPELQYELEYLAATLPEMESYLLSKDLYRMIHLSAPRGFPPYPSMTLGTILLSLFKARAFASTFKEDSEVIKAEQSVITIRQKWHNAWQTKAQAELHNRSIAWRTFLGELYSAPQENRDRYTYEVRQRVIIELLLGEISAIPEQAVAEIEQSDSLLRSLLKPLPFIWSEKLEQSFPPTRFWFLYGKP